MQSSTPGKSPVQPRSYAEAYVRLLGEMKPRPPVAFEFLAKHAKPFTLITVPLSGTYPLGRCYKNAALCAGPVKTYCEGYAVAKNLTIPLSHAWLSADGVEAIDPTWEDGVEYFGVGFSQDFLLDFQTRTKLYGVFEGLYALRMTPAAALTYLESGLVYGAQK